MKECYPKIFPFVDKDLNIFEQKLYNNNVYCYIPVLQKVNFMNIENDPNDFETTYRQDVYRKEMLRQQIGNNQAIVYVFVHESIYSQYKDLHPILKPMYPYLLTYGTRKKLDNPY